MANRLYRRGIKSHTLAALSRSVGANESTATIVRNLREAGLIAPTKAKVGKWSKRKGSLRPYRKGFKWTSPLPEPAGWAYRAAYGPKNRILAGTLVRIASAFCAWLSFAQAGGHFDLEVVLEGEKPP